MSAQTDSSTARLMDRLAAERASEARVRRVARLAWAGAAVVLTAWIVLTITQAVQMMPVVRMPGGPGISLLVGIFMPVLFVLLGLAVLVGTLSTVALFLRERRATFEEIQLRLATLEELLTARDASP